MKKLEKWEEKIVEELCGKLPLSEEEIEKYGKKIITSSLMPSIVVYDNDNDVTYTVKKTLGDEYIKRIGCHYIALEEEHPLYNKVTLFDLDEVVFKRITFMEDDLEISIDRDYTKTNSPNKRMVIRYFKNDGEKKHPLLTKMYIDLENGDYFEQIYTFGGVNCEPYEENNNSVDYYAYHEKGGITYGVQKYLSDDQTVNMQGVCFQNTKAIDEIETYLPYLYSSYGLYLDKKMHEIYSKMYHDDNLALISFASWNNHYETHILNVQKKKSGITGTYGIEDKKTRKTAISEFSLPNYNERGFDTREIDSIMEVVSSYDNLFTVSVCEALDTFEKCITKEEDKTDNYLNPRYLYQLDDDTIISQYINNSDEYFRDIDKEFRESTNLNISKGKEKRKCK